MNDTLIIQPQPKTTATLDNVVDTKEAARIVGAKNGADVNKAAREGYIPYKMMGTAYCYDKNNLIEGWKEYQANTVQKFNIALSPETKNLFMDLKDKNNLSDEQLFQYLVSLAKNKA